ncbi:hypothetical protein BVC80_8691g4 [Macleaya cordata]|uniref:Zinc finger protein n=1 Tax=Macleaya cordata TaxID=56857 RepID=A0A200Q0H9_MACCD|nr:hypothetical protein BVC80_8691g4 [Macleaya cordata]
MAHPSEKFCSGSNFHKYFEVYQLCDQTSHIAIDCPWMYSKCLFPKCLGLRMLLTCDSNISKGKKYLKCHMPDCEGFQWLDDAMKGKISSVKCYLCEDDDHVGKDCPWEGYPCKISGCSGWRHILTSHTKETPREEVPFV